jgi:hypothetical protein
MYRYDIPSIETARQGSTPILRDCHNRWPRQTSRASTAQPTFARDALAWTSTDRAKPGVEACQFRYDTFGTTSGPDVTE